MVVPGFAGSNLLRGSEQVWPSLKLLGHPELLRVERPLEARGIVEQLVVVPGLLRLHQYSALTDYLRQSLGYEVGRDLLEFAYDFRQDNRRSATELGAAIEQWNLSAPITIIAHSMGCLIARYYIERLGGKRRVERVVLLGGPHAGNPYAFARLLSGPKLLPLGMKNVQWRERLATFPSWYQILPTYPCVSDGDASLDVLADDSWLPEQQRPLLHDARRFRQELGTHSSVPAVCIFGYGHKTIAGASVERTAGRRSRQRRLPIHGRRRRDDSAAQRHPAWGGDSSGAAAARVAVRRRRRADAAQAGAHAAGGEESDDPP